MFRKKEMILTATTCNLLENLRLAIEVLKGMPIRLKHIHLEKGFTSGRGSFYVGDEEFTLVFINISDTQIHLTINDVMYSARFDKPREVRIIDHDVTKKNPQWMVGTSIADRHEEPLYDN